MHRRLLAAFLAGLAALLPASAHADWRDDVKVLRVGFLAVGRPADEVARLEPFRAYLQARLAVPVELAPATTLAALVDAQVAGRVQYAIDSAVSYVTAVARCKCVEPLAAPLAADGSRGFYAVLLARAGGPIQSLETAEGARLALSGADSLAGRLLPLAGFAAAGIDPATYFSKTETYAAPEAAVAALLAGSVDLAAGWSSLSGDAASGYSFGLLARMVVEGSLAMDGVAVVWRSPLIPFGPHAVAAAMPADERAAIADALSAMAVDAPDVVDLLDRTGYQNGGFAPVSDADYAAVAALVAPTNR
jgi:phosphonate transport system substrate-binding protein